MTLRAGTFPTVRWNTRGVILETFEIKYEKRDVVSNDGRSGVRGTRVVVSFHRS